MLRMNDYLYNGLPESEVRKKKKKKQLEYCLATKQY